MGVSWAMLSSWGVSAADYVLYTLVSGIWNVFARLGLPVLALLVLVTASRPGAGLVTGAGSGPRPARRRGRRARPAAAQRGSRARRRPRAAAHGRRHLAAGPPAAARLRWPVAAGFRERAAGLLAARGWRITAATAAAT